MSKQGSLWKTTLGGLALAAALGLAACGKSDDGMGSVNIGLTDAAGDFLSYAVDVTSLTLTKADGTVVETVPLRTRVDFAQLADLTEFVSGATIPAGTYVAATVSLDFATADLEVDDGNGVAVPVPLANIRDAQGNPVSTMAMNVRLDNARQLTVVSGVPALLDLDFNLAASNAVDMTNPASPVVTVSPLLVADVSPDAPKPHRIRGPLDSVNLGSTSFTLILRPFNLVQGDYGRLTFATDANTQFEVNQVASTGAAGLQALSLLPRLSAIVAVGTLVPGTRRFLATEVRAGSSVAFGTNDVLTGNVLARSGNSLTVKGAELVRNNGTLVFRDVVSVTIGAGTKVIKEGSAAAVTIADISVGQRVNVFGTLDMAGTQMTATSGLVRLAVTQLNGTASSVGGGAVGMALARIDGRPVALFDFTGTGTPGNDADPAAYVVATGSLPLVGIVNGTPLKVRGFPVPFNQAGATGDFTAVTLIDVTNSPAVMLVGWPALEATPFGAVAPNSLRLNLTNAPFLRDVLRDGVDTRFLTTDTPFVKPPALGGLFVIGANGTLQVFTRFDAFQQALQSNLGGGLRARGFFAAGGPGSYVDSSKTLTAGVIAISLQ